MEQMYAVVAEVDKYTEFVPWCKESIVSSKHGNHYKCKLTVGFPPVVEKYTSIVTVSKPHLVRVSKENYCLFIYTSKSASIITCTINLQELLVIIKDDSSA